MLASTRVVLMCAAGLAISACGGSGGGAGGSAGDAGSGASTSTSASTSGSGSGGGGGGGGGGTGGTTATGCPVNEPVEGDVCGPTYMLCKFGPGECCLPTMKACENGVWSHVYVDCAQISCPSEAPQAGASCCPSTTAPDCLFGTCVSDATITHASCTPEGTWTVDVQPCGPPVDCGGVVCDPGMVCVETSGGAAITRSCQPDPCPTGLLSCTCAGSLCSGAPFECSTQPGLVSCTCATCP